jgi:hypothetical protein
MPLDEYNRGLEVIETALCEAIAQEEIIDYTLLYSKDDGISPAMFILTFDGKSHRKNFNAEEIETCQTHVYGGAVAKIRELISEAKGDT